jgi:biotin carboxyl carrier protein
MSDVSLTSDVTGSVWKVLVATGDQVKAEQALVVVESMKMEIEVLAPADGEVTAILVQEGEMVEEDQPLLTLRCAT